MPHLLFLIGNRDVQLAGDRPLPEGLAPYVVRHNDGADWTIDKAKGAKHSFLAGAEAFLAQYKTAQGHFTFPMIQATLDHLGIDPGQDTRLVFLASRQQLGPDGHPHFQDTFHFAEIAARFYAETGYQTQAETFSVNPNDFAGLVEMFMQQFAPYGPEHPLIISNSGGTPNMRAASHFAGVLRGFTYVHVNSFGGEVTQSTFQAQEQQILARIIDAKLKAYDYEGVRLLPVSAEIIRICEIAIGMYNLDTDYIRQREGEEEKAMHALELIFNNLLVCYTKGAYAECAQRIVRLEEGIGQLLFYRLLRDRGWLDAADQVALQGQPGPLPYQTLIASPAAKATLVVEKLPQAVEFDLQNPETRIHFRHRHFAPVNIRAVAPSKHFYYFLFRSLDLHSAVYDFWEGPNGRYPHPGNPLMDLRNHSLAGHGFAGVGKDDLQRVLGDWTAFIQHLEGHIEALIGRPVERVFDNLNSIIFDKL